MDCVEKNVSKGGDHKVCTLCLNPVSIALFSPHKTGRDGLSSRCRPCVNLIAKEYRKRPEVIAKSKSPESIASRKLAQKKYYARNREKCIAKAIRSRNPLKHREASKRYFYRHHEKYLKRHRERFANLSKVERKALAKRTYQKSRSTPSRILFELAKRRIKKVLKGHSKCASTRVLLGCSKEEFVQYIESLWKTGMTWENYGSRSTHWQIDHIIPCASFDHSDPEQQKQCFHWTNCRPIWAKENWSKNRIMPSSEICEAVRKAYLAAVNK